MGPPGLSKPSRRGDEQDNLESILLEANSDVICILYNNTYLESLLNFLKVQFPAFLICRDLYHEARSLQRINSLLI